MKKNIILLIAIIITVASCKKDLVSVNYSEINPAIFPKTEEDLKSMVNAAYYPLRGAYIGGIHSTSEKGVMYLADATTEILHGAYGDQNLASLHNFKQTDAGFTHYYDDYSKKISEMTLTIDLITKSTLSDDSKRKAIAEVRCARGIMAYTLFDLYGPIPIAPLEVLKNPLVEAPLARLSNAEMVAFISADLAAAAADLPSPADAEYGRFSKALAKMIDIRLNLHEKNWTRVKTLCDEIIAYNSFVLDPNYVGMWDLEGAKNSREVIWAIPCNTIGTSENQWQLMVLPPNYPGKGGFGTIQSKWWFYDRFETDDLRKTMLITQFTGTDGIVYNRSNPGTYLNFGPLALKINPDVARTTGLTTVDIIMYRYADVLLSKAEAIAKAASAPNAEAMALVNTVRARAGLPNKLLANFNTLQLFSDLVLLERSHEFWCENGQYRADLIRNGKFVTRCVETEQSIYTNINKAVYPFSLRAILDGKGKFIQNPGYN